MEKRNFLSTWIFRLGSFLTNLWFLDFSKWMVINCLFLTQVIITDFQTCIAILCLWLIKHGWKYLWLIPLHGFFCSCGPLCQDYHFQRRSSLLLKSQDPQFCSSSLHSWFKYEETMDSTTFKRWFPVFIPYLYFSCSCEWSRQFFNNNNIFFPEQEFYHLFSTHWNLQRLILVHFHPFSIWLLTFHKLLQGLLKDTTIY